MQLLVVTAHQVSSSSSGVEMSDTEKDLAVHVAVCDERYRNIEESLKSGERRMTKIEYLIYAVMAMVMFGPGVAAQFFHKFFGI